jgi:hypothetical protein
VSGIDRSSTSLAPIKVISEKLEHANARLNFGRAELSARRASLGLGLHLTRLTAIFHHIAAAGKRAFPFVHRLSTLQHLLLNTSIYTRDHAPIVRHPLAPHFYATDDSPSKMPRYKRSAEDAQLDLPTEPEMAPETAKTLKDLRDMWEFASLMQYIFLFGNVVKIDEDFDIEV